MAGSIEQWIGEEKHDARGRRLRLPRRGRRARLLQRRRRDGAPAWSCSRPPSATRATSSSTSPAEAALVLAALSAIAAPAPHRAPRLRRARAREHPRGVRDRDRARCGRARGGRAATARRRPRRAPRPRRCAGRAADRRRPGAGGGLARRPQPRSQGRAASSSQLIGLVRDCRPDGSRDLHGRQLGDAGRHPPRRAGHPRGPDDAAPRSRRSASTGCSGCGTPGARRRLLAEYDAQLVSCSRRLVSRLLVHRLHRAGGGDLGLDGRPARGDRAAAAARGRRHLLRRSRQPRLADAA